MGDDIDRTFDTVMSEAEEDAPTERFSEPPAVTHPTHAGVLDPLLAASIRADYAATVSEDDRITFVATVGADGKIEIPEGIRASRAIGPGVELLVQARKVG